MYTATMTRGAAGNILIIPDCDLQDRGWCETVVADEHEVSNDRFRKPRQIQTTLAFIETAGDVNVRKLADILLALGTPYCELTINKGSRFASVRYGIGLDTILIRVIDEHMYLNEKRYRNMTLLKKSVSDKFKRAGA